MTTLKTDNCIECDKPTNFGSGRFVNRVPSDEGFVCAQCMMRECDLCGQPIPLDEDVWVNELNVCQQCFLVV